LGAVAGDGAGAAARARLTEPPSSSHSPSRPLTVVTSCWVLMVPGCRPSVSSRGTDGDRHALAIELRYGDEAGAEVVLHQGVRERTPAGVNTRWRMGICNDCPTMIAARPPSMVCTCCEMSRRLLLSDW
jgi:hypothetical protein